MIRKWLRHYLNEKTQDKMGDNGDVNCMWGNPALGYVSPSGPEQLIP